MPPHCDSLDGPVVQAARRALEAGDVTLVLPYVLEDGEGEIRHAFGTATRARAAGRTAEEVADRWFYETVVRVHRAGEGASYTGLKPAGLDVGPAIPLAEHAIETGSAEELVVLLSAELREQLDRRLDEIRELEPADDAGVPERRAYVQAVLGLQVFSHHVYRAIHRG